MRLASISSACTFLPPHSSGLTLAALPAGLGRAGPGRGSGPGAPGGAARRAGAGKRLPQAPACFHRALPGGSAGVGAGDHPPRGPGAGGAAGGAGSPRSPPPRRDGPGASRALSAILPRPCSGWSRRLCRGACPGPGSSGNVLREKAALPPCPESGRCGVPSPSRSGPARLPSHPCELSLNSSRAQGFLKRNLNN